MRDGLGRRVVKRLARAIFAFDLAVVRRLRRISRQPVYQLAGDCRKCAKCCESPAIRVGRLVWYLGTVRWVFLSWQRRINGFELESAERRGRLFTFRCTHFDRTTRTCDSYDSRPGICRDYPRALLDQPWPEFFPECGYRPRAPSGFSLLEALEETDLSDEQREALTRKLMLD